MKKRLENGLPGVELASGRYGNDEIRDENERELVGSGAELEMNKTKYEKIIHMALE